jgi:hypothetical protein
MNIKKYFKKLLPVIAIVAYILICLFNKDHFPELLGYRQYKPMDDAIVINTSEQELTPQDVHIGYDNGDIVPMEEVIKRGTIKKIKKSPGHINDRISKFHIFSPDIPRRVTTEKEDSIYTRKWPQHPDLKFRYLKDDRFGSGDIYMINFTEEAITQKPKEVFCTNLGLIPIKINGIKYEGDLDFRDINEVEIKSRTTEILNYNSDGFKEFRFNIPRDHEKYIKYLNFNETDGGVVGVEISNSVPDPPQLLDLIKIFFAYIFGIILPVSIFLFWMNSFFGII